MPVGVEQWRVAVGVMANVVASKPQSPIELCWKKWLKSSDPVIYKGCIVLLVMVTQFMLSGIKQCMEKMKKCTECVCQSVVRGRTQLNLSMSVSLLKRHLHSFASLAYKKCNKITVAESVASPLFSTNWRTDVRMATMIVFVNQMLLMRAGDVERNPGPVTLGPSDLRCVRSAINSVRHKWYDIGVELDIAFQTLNVIKTDCPQNSAGCLREMLVEWLSRTSPAPSWSSLVDALSSEPVGEKRLADEIRAKYCLTEDQTAGIQRLQGQEPLPDPTPVKVVGSSTPPSFRGLSPCGEQPPYTHISIASLYRYWNGQERNHLYTTSACEIGVTLHGQIRNNGYISQGVQCYLYVQQAQKSVPLYRYWQEVVKDSFYTTNSLEIGTTTPGEIGKHGYKSEGIAGYCFPENVLNTVPLYRYYNSRIFDHFYTTDYTEIDTVTAGEHGYAFEGIACFVLPVEK